MANVTRFINKNAPKRLHKIDVSGNLGNIPEIRHPRRATRVHLMKRVDPGVKFSARNKISRSRFKYYEQSPFTHQYILNLYIKQANVQLMTVGHGCEERDGELKNLERM